MNDIERMSVMIYKLLMYYETELDDRIENRKLMLDRLPTPDAAHRFCQALEAREQFNDIANRLRSVLDFFKGNGV